MKFGSIIGAMVIDMNEHMLSTVARLSRRHAATGNPLDVKGWEEWDLDADGSIAESKGWFDAGDYARQVSGQ